MEELVGRPSHQVMRPHAIAPISPARMTRGVTVLSAISPLPTMLATPEPNRNSAAKLKNDAHKTACVGLNTLRRDDGGDGIGGVMKAVDEIEGHAAAITRPVSERGRIVMRQSLRQAGIDVGALPGLAFAEERE